MKKSKMAAKSSAKKMVSKPKKSLSSALKKTANKLLSKMTAKAKKPQVKVPAKVAAKPAVKAPVKAKPVAPAKAVKAPVAPVKAVKGKAQPEKQAKPVELKKAVKGAPVESVKDAKKNSSKATTPVVAAVLTKAPAGKAAKPSKAAISSAHMCREANCENTATTKGYCRLDYIKNWKKIKRKEMILKEGKLNQYIEELVSKYPDKYIDVIRQDLSTEVNFTKVIHDLELDESIDDLDYDGDSIDALIGGIKKDIDDFGGTGGGDEEF
jgi:uncharacterized protein YihD (DUF1040 family)